MTRPLAALLCVLPFVVGIASCGPDRAAAPDAGAEAREAQAAEAAVSAPAPVEVGPVALEPAIQQADMRVRVETPEEAAQRAAAVEQRPASPNRVAPTPTQGEASLWRADGRPSWWSDQPGWRDGRYSVYAEAFGADVREARRAAIDAARRNAGSALGSIRDERVETAIVRAVGGEGTGGSRYVGYVRLSALRGE